MAGAAGGAVGLRFSHLRRRRIVGVDISKHPVPGINSGPSHNLRRVGAALDELARRVGFRVIPGLGERVIYRELFPKGLTLLDLQQLGEVGIAHITARQELREMIAGLAIPSADEVEQKVA